MKKLFLLVFVFFINFACDKESNRSIDTDRLIPPDMDSSSTIANYKMAPLKNLKFDIELNPDSVFITHYAILKTNFGRITIALFGVEAPKTVKNFVKLAQNGYYNGTLIHRIAKNFLIQMGDGNTKYNSKKHLWGTGGKSIYGTYIPDELNPNSYIYRNGYTYGTVAMANSGPNKNLSQFFICLEEAEDLERKYTIFGKVIEGMDVVEKIAEQPINPYPFDSSDGTPVAPIKIISVSIFSNKKI
ncbi:MAG: peptidylprolyl isomerase [Candidatus Kapaibacteriales bacterium]